MTESRNSSILLLHIAMVQQPKTLAYPCKLYRPMVRVCHF